MNRTRCREQLGRPLERRRARREDIALHLDGEDGAVGHSGQQVGEWQFTGATTVARFSAPCQGVLRATLGLVDDAPAGARVQAQISAGDQSVGIVGVSGPLQNGTLEAVLDQGKSCELRVEVSAPDHAWRMAVLALSIDPVAGGKP